MTIAVILTCIIILAYLVFDLIKYVESNIVKAENKVRDELGRFVKKQ